MSLYYVHHYEVREDIEEQISRTLIFPVSTLNLLVFTFLHLAFEHASALRFVKTCDFQDLGRVEPRV
jgi:hypothetical protein